MFPINSIESTRKNARCIAGTYRVYWIKKGTPQKINRLLGTDITGLLYIGQAEGSVQGRLNNFRCTAFLNSTNHSGAKKYRKIKGINRIIKSDELFFTVSYCNNSKEEEKKQLDAYRNKYGEVPPLNG